MSLLVFHSKRVEDIQSRPRLHTDFCSLFLGSSTISVWACDISDENSFICVISLRSVRLNLGLSIVFFTGLLGEVRGHGGCLHDGFEAAFSLLDVLLWVEDYDVNLWDVEHAQGHGCAQAHGHCEGGGLDEHLGKEHNRSERKYTHTSYRNIFNLYLLITSASIHQFKVNNWLDLSLKL